MSLYLSMLDRFVAVEGVQLDSLVCGCTILILSRILANPKVKIVIQILCVISIESDCFV